MIFEPKISPDFLVWIVALLILALLIFQIVKIVSGTSTTKTRKLLLNILFSLSLLVFLVNPKWEKKETGEKLLVYSKKSSQIQKIKDSLDIQKSVSYSGFVSNLKDYKNYSYYFLGQDLTADVLSNLEGKPLTWIPEIEKDSLYNLNWDAIISKGDLQIISGQINVEKPSLLKLKYAEKTLDSTKLNAGFNSFKLKTPVFISGKNSLSLELNNKTIQNINYFSTPQRLLNIVFLLDSPDFESRILAEWLGAQGHKLEMITKVADKTLHQTKVNKPSAVDLYIIYPAYLTDQRIKKAIELDKSVLVMGLDNVTQNLSEINKNLGTSFSTKRVSEAENLKLENEITTLPYAFSGAYKKLDDLPVAIQKRGGKIGVSLINETFPAKLSGDTSLYSKTWLNILSILKPADTSAIYLKAPVYSKTNQRITTKKQEILKIDEDTIAVSTFGINPATKFTEYVFSNTGWTSINDSLAVYIEPETKNAAILPMLLQNVNSKAEFSKQYFQIPDLYWFLIWLVLLTALWLEPKLKS